MFKITHKYLVRTKLFRIYLGGSYAGIEINIGEIGKDLALFLFVKDPHGFMPIRVKKY